MLDAPVSGAHIHHRFPVAHRQLDGLDAAPHQDRAGNDHAGRNLLLDRKIGAEPEHHALHQRAVELGERHQDGAAVAGPALPAERLLAHGAPAPAQLGGHAHGLEHLGIAQGRRRQGVGGDAGAVRGGEAGLGRAVVEHGEGTGKQRAAERQIAVIGMQQRGADGVDGHPWQVAQGGEGGTGEEIAYRVEIPQGLCLAGAAISERGALDGVEHRHMDLGVEGEACPLQHARPQRFQRRPHDIEEGRDEGEQDQGLDAAGRQHAVVHLHHVDRGVQAEEVDEEAEDDHGDEGGADVPQGLIQRGGLVRGRGRPVAG